METYQTANFVHAPNNLSRDIVLTDGCPEKKQEKKKNKKSKTNRSAFACRSNNMKTRGREHKRSYEYPKSYVARKCSLCTTRHVRGEHKTS